MPRIWRDCVDCGSDFYITEKTQDYCASQQYEFPKRCWKCRQILKREREAQERDDHHETWNGDGDSGELPEKA